MTATPAGGASKGPLALTEHERPLVFLLAAAIRAEMRQEEREGGAILSLGMDWSAMLLDRWATAGRVTGAITPLAP